jgi:hypothetical protein
MMPHHFSAGIVIIMKMIGIEDLCCENLSCLFGILVC